MADTKNDLNMELMKTEFKEEDEKKNKTNEQEANPVVYHEFEYKQFGNSPKITLSGLTLIILCPILICAHVRLAKFCEIPMVQFSFVTMLIGFLFHYTFIIRRYELMPYLPESVYDFNLKKICVAGVVALAWSIMWGWNGSGGILFAMYWQYVRGNKMGFYGTMLLIIIAGSIAMEDNFSYWKLMQFVPGVLFGYINSVLYTLRESSVYAINHQFIFLASIFIPMFFPANKIIVPALWQWGVMIICGFTVLLTVILTIKLMQSERVSVTMGVLSGLVMIGTSSFLNGFDVVGCILIVVGCALLIKKEYIDLQY